MATCASGALKGIFEVVCVAGGLARCEFITAASTEFQNTSLTAIATSSGDIFLYCQQDGKSYIKVIPWPAEENPKPSALTFDPTSEWLLVATEIGSIYIVPVGKYLKRSHESSDPKFPLNDIVMHQPSGSRAKPTAIVWWQTMTGGVSVAIIGTELGELCFVELTSGKDVGGTYITIPVKEMFLCKDNSLDTVYLLITGTEDRQWRLVLEQKSQHFMFPLENISPEWEEEDNLVGSLPLVATTPSPRLRLMNLKQLSVEKFQLLKQRLSEAKHSSKKKPLTENKGVDTCDIDEEPSADSTIITPQLDNAANSICSPQRPTPASAPANTTAMASIGTTITVTPVNPSLSTGVPIEGEMVTPISTRPERIHKYIYDVVATPQYSKEKCLLAGLYKPNSCLMVYSPDLENTPMYVYKLPENTEQVILNEELIYALRKGSSTISVVSTFYSASNKIDGEIDNKINPVLQEVHLPDGEEILHIFSWPSTPTNGVALREESNSSLLKEENEEKNQNQETSDDVDSEFDYDVELPSHTKPKACLVVTKTSLYICQTRKTVENLFMELALGAGDIEAANKLTVIFSLDSKLFELAADAKLQKRCFASAITLYKQSRCPHVKCALKFAWAGFVPEFITYMSSLTSGSGGPDLGLEQRKHLANLAVIAHLHQLSLPFGVRSYMQQQTTLRNLLLFLRNNIYYDEILALVISAATWRWETLQYLTSNRGLLLEKLHALLNLKNSPVLIALHQSKENGCQNESITYPICRETERGFLHCISDPELRGVLLLNPLLARSHMAFVLDQLDILDVPILRRLAALYDPTQAAIKPFLLSAYFHKPTAAAYSQSQKANQSCTLLPPASDDPIGLDTLTQIFLAILIKLNQKRGWKHNPNLLTLNPIEPVKKAPFYDSNIRRKNLACGYGHSVVIIEGSIYSWGLGDFGALGNGPNSLTNSKVLHNLDTILSMEYAELSTNPAGPEVFNTRDKEYLVQSPEGSDGECFHPKLVSYLSSMKAYSVSCGKHHVLAITNYGVYGWGSSRYGQVGYGGTGRMPRPTLITSLINLEVVHVACGQFHSLAVTKDGRLLTWGWGVHGQLGHGNVEDCLKPTPVVKLSKKKIVFADAGYAHSVALTDKGVVYAWGCSTYGQVGAGGISKITLPVKISIPEQVIHLTSGYFHNLASTIDHKIYVWGSNPSCLRVQAQIQRRYRAYQQTLPDAASEENSNGDKTEAKEKDDNSAEIKPDAVNTHIDNAKDNETKDTNEEDSPVDQGEMDNVPADTVPAKSCFKTCGPQLVSANTVPSCDPLELGHLMPKQLDMPFNYGAVKSFAAGSQHSLVLTTHGKLYSWGRNMSGQLGTGSRRETFNPIPIMDDVYITEIASGADFNLAFDSEGHVWGWGSNYYTQLGQGCNVDEKSQANKVFMLRTSKRVLKVPHSIHSNVEVPRIIAHLPVPSSHAGLPAQYVHAAAAKEEVDLNDMGILSGVELASLEYKTEEGYEKEMEDKDDGLYGTFTLHTSLAYLHQHYSSKNLSQILLDCEAHQALATLYTLEKQHSRAMHHQLCALLTQSKVEEMTQKDTPESKDSTTEEAIHKDTYTSSHINEAVRILDHFLHLQTEESQSGMRLVLQEGIGLWLTHSLPIPQLEDLLLTHLPRTVYPLALLLFGEEGSVQNSDGAAEKSLETETVAEATARILSQLSTKFCLNLCSSVITHLQSGDYNVEQLDALSQLARLHSVSGIPSKDYSTLDEEKASSPSGDALPKATADAINLSPDEVTNLRKMSEEDEQEEEKGARSKRDLTRSKSQDKDKDKDKEKDKDSVLFTCGHHFTNKDFKTKVLPQLERTVTTVPGLLGKTARVLLDQYHSDQPQMACPHCVLAHLTIKLTKHNQPS